jgi:hypothetical protein
VSSTTIHYSTETLYYATYVETDATPAEWHDWLVNVMGGETEPSELSTITDVCAGAKCRAELRDEAGWLRGHVGPDGNWRLT